MGLNPFGAASGGTPEQPQREIAFQMLWDCGACGTKKLLGIDHRHCPNCGTKQDPQWRYFPSDEDRREITSPNYQYAGADRVCPFCGQPNSAKNQFCTECGGDLSGGKEAFSRGVVEKGSAEDIREAEDLVLKKFRAEQAAAKPKGTNWGPILLIGAIVLLAVAVFGFISLSNSTYDARMSVTAVTWERTLFIEQLRAVPGSGWQDSVPLDALSRSCSPRQREYIEYERKQTGVQRVDRGDGSFVERPVYSNVPVTRYRTDQWCTYIVNRWVPDGTRQTKGGLNDPLTWPTFTESGSGVGGRRIANRTESLLVQFKGEGDKAGQNFTYAAPNETKWRTFAVGQTYTVKINRLEVVQWETLTKSDPR